MSATVYAREFAQEHEPREAVGRDHVKLSVVGSRGGREHHTAARVGVVHHCDQVGSALERRGVVDLHADEPRAPACERAQSREGDPPYDRLHAYLHRKEGDRFNANYWYRRAGTSFFAGSLGDEWSELVRQQL